MSIDRAAQEQRAKEVAEKWIGPAPYVPAMASGASWVSIVSQATFTIKPHAQLVEELTALVAAALAACAREARLEEANWWAERLNSKRRDKWLYGFKEVERERIEALERAAGESK